MEWISVKDRLPERDGESIYVECIVTIWHYGTDILGNRMTDAVRLLRNLTRRKKSGVSGLTISQCT